FAVVLFLRGVRGSRASRRHGDGVRDRKFRHAQRIRSERNAAASLGTVARRYIELHATIDALWRAVIADRLAAGCAFPEDHGRIHDRYTTGGARAHLAERGLEMEAHDRARHRLSLRERSERLQPVHSLR